MHIRKAANLSIMEKSKLAINTTSHKKQNTLTDSSIFKYLTSPRSSKNKYKIPSSRLEVLNLTKDQATKQRKPKNRLLYGSAIISDAACIKKIKNDSKSKLIGVTSSFQESSNPHLKLQSSIQLKPKTKCKKNVNFGGMTKRSSNKVRKSCRKKTELKFKDNLTNKMMLNLTKGCKNDSIDLRTNKMLVQDNISENDSKQQMLNKLQFQTKIQQGLDNQTSSLKSKSILEYKTEDHRGFK